MASDATEPRAGSAVAAHAVPRRGMIGPGRDAELVGGRRGDPAAIAAVVGDGIINREGAA